MISYRAKNQLYSFSRFDTTPAWQTDRQTHYGIPYPIT